MKGNIIQRQGNKPDPMTAYQCTNCRRAYPEDGAPYRCPICGGIYDLAEPLSFKPESIKTQRDLPGIWRYQSTFALPTGSNLVTLGEGNTPLVWGEVDGHKVAFKLEGSNPSGSFKDRGSSVLASFLLSRGVNSAVEDSSGNAGASFAAYAARAGIHAKIFIPESAAGPKRAQIGIYGAEVIEVPGSRSDAAEAVLQAATAGAIYASHAFHPSVLEGYATLAYELVEGMDPPPGTIILPAGQGNLLLGIYRGLLAIKKAGILDKMPVLIGVQARVCAPLWAVFQYGAAGLGWVSEGRTLADGVAVSKPMRGDAVIRAVEEAEGTFVAVDEDEILPARDALASLGLFVEPTSALPWIAFQQLKDNLLDPVVMILTGSGLKTPETLILRNHAQEE